MNLVSHLARQTALQQQAVVLLLEHEKKQQRRRRAAQAGVRKKKRRGAWNPKPRSGDANAMEPRAQWEFDMTKCIWCSLFDNQETFDENSYWGLYFYEEFHMPRCIFEELLSELQKVKGLSDRPPPGGGRRPHPARFKLAASILVLTEGLTLTRAAKLGCMEPGHCRKLFHLIMASLKAVAHKHIYLPRNHAELRCTEQKFAKSGFPGAFLSMDVVHVKWRDCPWKLKQLCTGKEGYPTLAWNVGVDRNKIVTYVPMDSPHWGARNDKTQAMLDDLCQTLKDGRNPLLANYEFTLRSGPAGASQRHKGVYAITDGGYHQWRCLMSGNSYSTDLWLGRLSKRLESVRKDPECKFGALKKRFACLDIGMRWRKVHQHHNVFVVCCMIDNMISRHRKYNTVGEDDGDWKAAQVASDLLRLQSQHASRRTSAHLPQRVDDIAVGNVTKVQQEAAFFLLRHALVTNYRISFEEKTVLWLKPFHTLRGRIDMRPLREGGGRKERAEGEACPHAWCSDVEDEEDGGHGAGGAGIGGGGQRPFGPNGRDEDEEGGDEGGVDPTQGTAPA